jgi:hypothetical protein
MNDWNIFERFWGSTNFTRKSIRHEDEIIVQWKNGPNTETEVTVGYDDIYVIGVFDVETAERKKLFVISHVAHWPEEFCKYQNLVDPYIPTGGP